MYAVKRNNRRAEVVSLVMPKWAKTSFCAVRDDWAEINDIICWHLFQ